MAKFYLARNRESRVAPDPVLVRWLSKFPDDHHALIDIAGPDFRSRCLLIKPRAIISIYVDARKYKRATKDGPWVLEEGKQKQENPTSKLTDQTEKIREFIIIEKEKIFEKSQVDPGLLETFSKNLRIPWLVVLTNPQNKKSPPKVSGWIFCNEPSFLYQLNAKSFNWNPAIPSKIVFESATASRLANLLGLEPADIDVVTSIKPARVSVPANPYHFTSEVGPERFRGRTTELREAKSYLISVPSTPVLLVGLQRTGKSSLAGEVMRQLQEEQGKLRVISYVFGGWDEEGEFADVAGFLLQQIPDKENISSLIDSIPKLKRTVGLEREIFKKALSHLKKVTKQETLLYLDELHKLNRETAGKGQSTFGDFLETVIKDKTLGLRLIVSARPVVLKTKGLAASNLFKLFHHIQVGSMDDASAHQIINLGAKHLQFTDDAVARILELSGNNPYWIQLICSETFTHIHNNGKTSKVSRNTIEAVFSEILRGNGAEAYFATFYQDVKEEGPPFALLHECGFRGKAGAIPGSIRSAFRNESGHDYGMNPVTDSDFKPVTLGRFWEP